MKPHICVECKFCEIPKREITRKVGENSFTSILEGDPACLFKSTTLDVITGKTIERSGDKYCDYARDEYAVNGDRNFCWNYKVKEDN